MKCKKIVLGYVPVMRDTFPVAPARQMRDRIRARVDEILQAMSILNWQMRHRCCRWDALG